MYVVIVVPVVMISVVVVPVIRSPGSPGDRVVTPVPGRAPYNVIRHKDESYNRPGCYLVSGGPDKCNICCTCSVPHIAGVGSFIIYGFNNVISAI